MTIHSDNHCEIHSVRTTSCRITSVDESNSAIFTVMGAVVIDIYSRSENEKHLFDIFFKFCFCCNIGYKRDTFFSVYVCCCISITTRPTGVKILAFDLSTCVIAVVNCFGL